MKPEQGKPDREKTGVKSSDTARKMQQDKENKTALISQAEQWATPAAQTEPVQSQTKTAKNRKHAAALLVPWWCTESLLQDPYQQDQDPEWASEDTAMGTSMNDTPEEPLVSMTTADLMEDPDKETGK